MAFVKNPGTRIEIGGVAYVMPPLSIGQMEQLQADEMTALLKGGASPNKMRLIGDLTFGALQRNYPDVKREDLVQHIDLSNFTGILTSLLETSNFTKDDSPPPEMPSGEAPAIGTDSGST